MASPDFSCPCIIGYDSSSSRCGPPASAGDGQTREDSLRSREFIISWLTSTPHAPAVYASCSASPPPHATLASRRPATALPGPDLHRLIAPALLGAFLHSITSSAMESRLSENVTPSALAVLRLITNSNLVGCATGRSAGLAPLRLRPVLTPIWR